MAIVTKYDITEYLQNQQSGGSVILKNGIARARWAVHSAVTRRVLFYYAHNISPTARSFSYMEIPIGEVVDAVYFKDMPRRMSKDEKIFRLMESLRHDGVEILECPTGNVKSFSIFESEIDYYERNKMLYICPNENLRNYLLAIDTKSHEGHWTALNYAEFMALPTSHSQTMYQYAKSWENAAYGIQQDNIMKVLRMFDAADSYYKNIANFVIQVIEPAYKKVIDLTHLKFRYELWKDAGRRAWSHFRLLYPAWDRLPDTREEIKEREIEIKTQVRFKKMQDRAAINQEIDLHFNGYNLISESPDTIAELQREAESKQRQKDDYTSDI